MKAFGTILIAATLAGRSARADELETGSWALPANAAEWEDATPASFGKCAVLVLDSPAKSELRGGFLAAPVPALARMEAVPKRTAEFLKAFSADQESRLKIEWFDGGVAATDFGRTLQPKDGRAESFYRLGGTGITRTVLVAGDGLVFIHLLANQPGALSFRVSLPAAVGSPARIEDRRQLIDSPASGIATHVWVIPFESEVATEGQAIAIRGEGEALVIWSFAATDEARKLLPGTLARLGERYNPGHSPPDPVKIWHGVLENHLKSIKNSP